MTNALLPTIDPVSYIRTYVPVAYGLLISWLIAQVPVIGDVLQFLEANFGLSQGFITLFLAAGTIALYYWAARKIGRRYPAIEKYLLGSSRAPIYVEQNKLV